MGFKQQPNVANRAAFSERHFGHPQCSNRRTKEIRNGEVDQVALAAVIADLKAKRDMLTKLICYLEKLDDGVCVIDVSRAPTIAKYMAEREHI